MWKEELSELLEATGYWIAVGAKLLHVVNETFCSIPIDGANFRYLDRMTFGALAAQCKPAKKRGSDGGVLVASPMIKLEKKMEKRKKGVSAVGVAYLSLVGSLSILYSNFSSIIGKLIL